MIKSINENNRQQQKKTRSKNLGCQDKHTFLFACYIDDHYAWQLITKYNNNKQKNNNINYNCHFSYSFK